MTEHEFNEQNVERYSVEELFLALIEELAELTQATTKLFKSSNNGQDDNQALDHFVEEFADVEIMLSQIKQGYGLAPAVELQKHRKRQRQIERW